MQIFLYTVAEYLFIQHIHHMNGEYPPLDPLSQNHYLIKQYKPILGGKQTYKMDKTKC